MTTDRASFRLYGIHVEIHAANAAEMARDFDFFTGSTIEPDDDLIRLTVEERDPKDEDLPRVPADRVFSECVVYKVGAKDCYEYSKAILFVERTEGVTSARLISADKDSIHERVYLFLQSEIGRILDLSGLHRIHAFGMGLPDGRAALVLLPSGGGKSTLALEVLKSGGVLLSDDSPLVDGRGRVWPYPMRLGFRSDQVLPETWAPHSTIFKRRRFGSKLLVSTRALPDSSLPIMNSPFEPGYLIIGCRHGGLAEPRLVPLRKGSAVKPLVRDLVIGLGTAQVIEMILSDGFFSLIRMVPRFFSRARAAFALGLRSRLLRFEMTRDPEKNAKFLMEYFRSESVGKRA